MTKKGGTYFTIFILAFALFFCVYSLTFGQIKTKLLPLAVSVLTLILAGIQLGTELVKKRRAQEEKDLNETGKGSNRKDDLHFYVTYFIWSLGLILGIYLLGFLISIPIFIFSFLLLHGQKSYKSALTAAIMTISLYVVFVLIFKIDWYEGIVVRMLTQ
jgi:Tripartite tricarboxylate transporter TctB family